MNEGARHVPRWRRRFVGSLAVALVGGLIAVGGEPAKPQAAAGSFVIPAWAFDRGNLKTFTDTYADAGPVVANGGEMPNVVEYDFELPVAAEWTISIYYAAAAPRPVEATLDQTRLGPFCRTATGSWNSSGAGWEQSIQRWIAPGKHTLRMECSGPFPHLVRLRLDSSAPFPPGWKLSRPKARKLDSPTSYLTVSAAEARAPSLRLAIQDLIDTFGPRYPKGPEYLRRLEPLEKIAQRMTDAEGGGVVVSDEEARRVRDELTSLAQEALLANPLLDFDKLLLVRRGAASPSLGLPMNWQSNSCLAKTGYDDQIEVLSPVRPQGTLKTLYKPDGGRFVGDVDLHFNADRMLFSMPGSNGRWQIFEIRADGTGLRQITGQEPDVDSYDACYLPNGRIMLTSTAYFVGVPCVYGSSHVAMLYDVGADGTGMRQLCFDQEHDWCPAVLNNGRVLYSRWEYTDTPHSNTRLLFSMNPDGTNQCEYVGSNSYWPNSFFYARPVPNHPTKVVAVIGGHHDNPRMGELVIFDPALGRHEASPAVQRIPGHRKKVEAIIRDGLTIGSWPKFLHPYPLSDKHFLVACKPQPQSLWGIYLVDTFDNFVLVKEMPGYALLEPIPLRKTPTPPVIPDRTNPAAKEAVVYLPDVYVGGGLKGVPRGTVKSMRIFTYHFAYQGMGGLLGVIGMDGPWDIKRVVGTVPVYEDGSAKFRIPANTPISLQPLDADGKALQLMRSWMTAMPGEVVQCSGCHEPQNTAPPTTIRSTLAMSRAPAEIQPWRGPVRGFSYAREVQPVIDKYCVSCHDGKPRPDGRPIADLRGSVKITDWASVTSGNGGPYAGKFSVGYAELHRFVRRPGIESDYHMLEPMEFHADTTHLVQLLQKGHYNVKLDAEAWDRLVTWIDLNCPYHGTWGEELAKPGVQRQRRRDLLKRYANVDDDPEAVFPTAAAPVKPILPDPLPAVSHPRIDCPGWPFDPAEAGRRQAAAGPAGRKKIDLGQGVTLELALVPAGQFVMGSPQGDLDERPLHRVRIEKPFWMATCEVTNRMYNLFDSAHDSRIEDKNAYQFGIHGYPMNKPEQPVVRVSWLEAVGFCRWLSQKSGLAFSLPTEAQWEYACRAGSDGPFWYGDLDTDFSKMANLADAKLSEFASDPYTVDTPLVQPTKYDDWLPKDPRFNDGAVLSVAPGRYAPNPWGLYDVHGNVAEWTRSTYGAYPSRDDPRAESPDPQGRKVVRGGSWRDPPKRCTSSFRLSYPAYQRVHNVGFRVIAAAEPLSVVAASPAAPSR